MVVDSTSDVLATKAGCRDTKLGAAAEAYIQKLKKRIKAIKQEIKAVKLGLGSVAAEAQEEEGNDADAAQQSVPQQGDLQRATMLNRLTALRAKRDELQARTGMLHITSQAAALRINFLWLSLDSAAALPEAFNARTSRTDNSMH